MTRSTSFAYEVFAKWDASSDDAVLEHLRKWIREREPESEHLEFKSGHKENNQALEHEWIKETWSKALSGFANTGGGVLVWGIETTLRKKIDVAWRERLVLDVESLHGTLHDLWAKATDPPVRGVQFRQVRVTSTSEEGFVVCLIPESELKPHRANWPHRQWKMRLASGFDDIPASLLRTLFFPQPGSSIRVLIRHDSINHLPNRLSHRYQISLVNLGPATANDIVVTMKSLDPSSKLIVYPSQDHWFLVHCATRNTFQHRIPVHVEGESGELGFSIESQLRLAEVRLAIRVRVPNSSPQDFVAEVPSDDGAWHRANLDQEPESHWKVQA